MTSPYPAVNRRPALLPHFGDAAIHPARYKIGGRQPLQKTKGRTRSAALRTKDRRTILLAVAENAGIRGSGREPWRTVAVRVDSVCRSLPESAGKASGVQCLSGS